MPDLSVFFLNLMYTVGFRTLLALAGLAGSLALAWLVLSLPGRRVLKLGLGLICLTGTGMLLAMNPLRSLGLALPTWAIRLVCLCTACAILLMLLQAARLLLTAAALPAALFTRAPLRLLVARKTSALVAVVGLLLGGMAFWNTVRIPEVREVDIPIRNLPASLENFHIVQLTDLHLGTIFDASWLAALVKRVNALHPDVVTVTGDTGEAAPEIIAADLAPLLDLRATDGVFYALGNHESYQGVGAWVRFYASAGHLLRNSHVVLTRDGAPLVLAGLDDAAPNLDKALTGSPAGAPRVLLRHRPGRAVDAADRGVDLQLSGHTHGGLMPGVRQIIARANSGYVSGLYRVDRMKLYVSNGTGLWSYVAVRLFTPSEITSFRLTRAR
ncbi:MAG TPA: metallophosphoesterase [Candidatus Mailhella merdigallinarum]|uniref:Metallophosphoesterase n=1 Tax=Candidatus Mailhella merdigallinarum TaxID=2838658 RepID=A0A9D2HD46_9BACT|nr:metallophosphoesterase [Desulfovibrionaceae bacterium]HJA08284.1 metallophosphoesterase [Candidatus Mailhella merdigallinarum]